MTKRKSLTKNQRVRVFDAHDGVCHICELPIRLGESWDADHVIPRGLTWRDDLEEYAPAHKSCHSVKTKKDNRDVKKAVRVRAKHLGLKKQTGWQSKFKKKVDGTVILRETGEPV